MAISYNQYFVGFPIKQIEEKMHSIYILDELYHIAMEHEFDTDILYSIKPEEFTYMEKNDPYKLSSQYKYPLNTVIHLHKDTIDFINWIQQYEIQLKQLGFTLNIGYNGNGTAPVIFGKYFPLRGDPDDTVRIDINVFDDIKNELNQFSLLLESLTPNLLNIFKSDKIITLWSNSHSS